MRKILIALVILLFPLQLFAIDINKADRVKNFPPGYCAFCCLETLGHHHKIKNLYNLAQDRTKDPDEWIWEADQWIYAHHNEGYYTTVKAKLDKLGIKHWIQKQGNFDRTLLPYANNYGCVVGMKAGVFGKYGHAIILTKYTETKVEFFDPNWPEYNWEASREWFDYYWEGFLIMVSN